MHAAEFSLECTSLLIGVFSMAEGNSKREIEPVAETTVDPSGNQFDEIRNKVFGPRFGNDPNEKDWRTHRTAELVAHEANLLSLGSSGLADPAMNAKRIAEMVGQLEKDQLPGFLEDMKKVRGFQVKTEANGTQISYNRDYPNYDKNAPWWVKTMFLPDIIVRDASDYLGRKVGGPDCTIDIRNDNKVVVQSNSFTPSKLLEAEKPFVKVEGPRTKR